LAARVFFEMQEQGGSDPSALRAVLFALVPGIGIMVLIGLAACLAPTLRALRISPVDALRADG
jgi:ABC-type lipoprotein release transport system permease subunit